jgi:hypothetical protein
MILDEMVITVINYKNIDYYKSIGYIDIKCNQKITIPVAHLPIESNLKIKVKCDVCGDEKSLSYQKYTKNIKKYNLYTCNTSCAQFKNKLTLKEIYGDENFNRSEENKLKTKEKYDNITKETEERGYIKCSQCGIENDTSLYLKNTNGRYKKICRYCRNKSAYSNRNKNPHIKAWRSVLKGFLQRNKLKKLDKTFNLLKYSPEQLKEHVSKQFTDDMTWENYGKWHIDHIVHLTLFKEDTPCHIVNGLKNLRPLDSKLNISRHNNLDDDCLKIIREYETYIKDECIKFIKI